MLLVQLDAIAFAVALPTDLVLAAVVTGKGHADGDRGDRQQDQAIGKEGPVFDVIHSNGALVSALRGKRLLVQQVPDRGPNEGERR